MTIGIWVLARRLTRSLLSWASSGFRLFSSSLTVVSSSLVDWSSSLAVSSSSLVLCSSSLLDWISSLADCSSSLAASCSSMTACRYSRASASSWVQLGHPTLARRLRSRLTLLAPVSAARAGWPLWRLLEEQDERAGLSPVLGSGRDHLEADLPDPAVRLDPQALDSQRSHPRLAAWWTAWRSAEASAFPRHLEEVRLALPGVGSR